MGTCRVLTLKEDRNLTEQRKLKREKERKGSQPKMATVKEDLDRATQSLGTWRL